MVAEKGQAGAEAKSRFSQQKAEGGLSWAAAAHSLAEPAFHGPLQPITLPKQPFVQPSESCFSPLLPEVALL